jgi:hypothetical protein
MDGLNIHYVRVPYWRTLRPRWVWTSIGFVLGLAVGVII